MWFCPHQGLFLMRLDKTRSTRDRSIPRSLQRWVSTKSSISQLTFFRFIIVSTTHRSYSPLTFFKNFIKYFSNVLGIYWVIVCPSYAWSCPSPPPPRLLITLRTNNQYKTSHIYSHERIVSYPPTDPAGEREQTQNFRPPTTPSIPHIYFVSFYE